jgi:mono/diheme cytochrome c family protein
VRSRRATAAGGALLALLLALPAISSAQDRERGRELAVRWCANCHVVERSATTGRADGLPTFPSIAARPQTTVASLQSFMNAQHGRMPDFQLSVRDRDDLAAYILGLRQ